LGIDEFITLKEKNFENETGKIREKSPGLKSDQFGIEIIFLSYKVLSSIPDFFYFHRNNLSFKETVQSYPETSAVG